MAKSKKKVSAKTASTQKRHHRQWITFLRMFRYGINNFTRNTWLTIAATAIMTITLFAIFVSLVSHNILTDTVSSLRDKVNMSIYLKTDATQEDVNGVVAEVKKLSSVIEVTVETPEDAREVFVSQNKADNSTLDAVKEATNKFPWTLNIKVVDINDTSQLAELVKNNEVLKANIDPDRDPSFAGDRRVAIEKIAQVANFAQQAGIIVSVIFGAISMLIIFNTIRMAIFNRREEIQMMKLIGAERSFIRGPFLVEAIVYGFFAALIATSIGYVLLMVVTPSLREIEASIDPTSSFLFQYAGFVVLAMVIAGAIIGIISSLLATRRYLKL